MGLEFLCDFFSTFYFFIVVNWEKGQSMENVRPDGFLCLGRKNCPFLCLAPFFSYHIKEKQGYISLDSGKRIRLLLLTNSVLLLLKGWVFFNVVLYRLYINFFLYNCVVEQKEHDHVSDLVKV